MPSDSLRVGLWLALNLGGHNKVAMADLRACLERLELSNSRTLLHSGNAMFRSRLSPSALESRLEAETRMRLSVDTSVPVRTAAEWTAIVDANPYRHEAVDDPSHLLVMCLKSDPKPGAENVLRPLIKGRERFHLEDRQAYVVYPDGIGRSPLTMAVVEKALGVVGTARNWNTVMKLQELL
ncbi:MAG: DUF1697 domain-containing protein [Acidimicrobiia bacterium]|nr:DUF1697 domain-containing protein [Acidimicrobiia bacterium]